MGCKLKNQKQLLLAVIALGVMIMMTSCVTTGDGMHSTPESDGTVRSNEGKVPVAIALRPGLQQGHRVVLSIDGKAVDGDFDGLAIELSGVERGTHSLRAKLIDEAGKALIESEAVNFTLRQTGLYDGNANPPGPPGTKPVPRPRPAVN